MSKHRFWWSVLAVWIAMVGTDWLFHGIWLSADYQSTAQYWRPQAEMMSMMPWMWFAQLIFSWAFVWIFKQGISKNNQWHQAFRYGMAILLVAKVPNQLGMWVTAPYPGDLVAKWLVVSTIQALLSAYVMTWAFKPVQWWEAQKSHQ